MSFEGKRALDVVDFFLQSEHVFYTYYLRRFSFLSMEASYCVYLLLFVLCYAIPTRRYYLNLPTILTSMVQTSNRYI